MSFNPPTTCAELLTSCSCTGTVTVRTIPCTNPSKCSSVQRSRLHLGNHYNVDSTNMQMNNVYHPELHAHIPAKVQQMTHNAPKQTSSGCREHGGKVNTVHLHKPATL